MAWQVLAGMVAAGLIVVGGCTNEEPVGTEATVSNDTVTIVDRSGREWDISHAVTRYDMLPEHFNFGIGLGAIPSVDEPEVISEGESGYPSPDDQMGVFGVVHNGEVRAYSVSQLGRHEVFNEHYPGFVVKSLNTGSIRLFHASPDRPIIPHAG